MIPLFWCISRILIPNSCLLRTSIFYMTGDLQSVDIQRHIYLKTLTNKRFQNTLNLYQLFNLPSFHTPSDGIKPIYYDINCTFQDLHLTVSFEFDKNDREILVISVNNSPYNSFLGNRKKPSNSSKYQGRTYSCFHRWDISSGNTTRRGNPYYPSNTPSLYSESVLYPIYCFTLKTNHFLIHISTFHFVICYHG